MCHIRPQGLAVRERNVITERQRVLQPKRKGRELVKCGLKEGEHKEWKETQGREAEKRINGGRMAGDGT